MSNDHPNVDAVNRMTKAIFDQDHDALAKIFTDDLVFHLRGAHPMAGDHAGLGGFLGVLGSLFESDRRPDRARPAVLRRGRRVGRRVGARHAGSASDDETLESRNAFVYRFEGDRIAEMWMFLGAMPEHGRGVLRLTADCARMAGKTGRDASHRGRSGGVRRPPVG